jgi:hypothetical protein
MRTGLLICFASGCLALVGCATSYQGKGLTGGYSDVRVDSNTFRVDFHGNAFTSRQTVETYLLRRCAELTVDAGYDYFVTLGSDTEARQGAYTTPGSYNSMTTGSATAYGNTVYGSATTTGTFHPGQTFVITKYGASATIKVFRGDKPTDNPNAYNAREVLHYLGAPDSQQQTVERKIEPQEDLPKPQSVEPKPFPEPQATLQSRPDPVKRSAQLTQTKGPFVTLPPQVLQAEYMDTGEGHGSARVIYTNNHILEGAYQTIASGQSFKGLVKATLIDPDRLLPSSSLRGFAAFTGTDGTVLECAYAVTSPGGSGSGTCVDNQKNQYRLSF